MPFVPRCLQRSEDARFHLMNRGHDREAIFANDEEPRHTSEASKSRDTVRGRPIKRSRTASSVPKCSPIRSDAGSCNK